MSQAVRRSVHTTVQVAVRGFAGDGGGGLDRVDAILRRDAEQARTSVSFGS
jgi:hypothetical protein